MYSRKGISPRPSWGCGGNTTKQSLKVDVLLKTVIFYGVFMRLFLALLLFSPLVFAQFYKWTDQDGRVHYSDRPVENSRQIHIQDNKVGSLVSKESKARLSTPKKTELQKAEENYQEVLSDFEETTEPDSACRYAVDLKDRYAGRFQDGSARKTYLCPKK